MRVLAPRSRKTLTILISAVAAAVYLFVQIRGREWGGQLAPGKVQPCFAGRLLLAPNGSIWLGDYRDEDGTTKVGFKRFLPGYNWVRLSGSEGNGFAINEDGSLWGWSSKFIEERRLTVKSPRQIGSDLDWADVKFGWNSALLLKRDGSMWFLSGKFRDSSWGFEPLTGEFKPVQIGTDNDWTAIATSGFEQYALKQDGTLWHWGDLVKRGPYVATPALMTTDDGWKQIAANFSTLVALKRDGSLWFGGVNANAVASQLVIRGKPAPYSAGSDFDWMNVVVGDNSFVAKKSDGSWWASGENHYAHLGLPHWFGHSKHLGRPKRIPLKLDVWAWQIEANTTKILTRGGNIYYIGKRPGSVGYRSEFKEGMNKAMRRIGRIPPLFARPGEDWSEKPVKIGELPADVISALRRNE